MYDKSNFEKTNPDSTSLHDVWSDIVQLLDDGLSIIPVRDKDDDHGAKKTQYRGWKQYQTALITQSALFNQMDGENTTAIAIIAGSVSGKLEIIDLDIKNKPGVDALVF